MGFKALILSFIPGSELDGAVWAVEILAIGRVVRVRPPIAVEDPVPNARRDGSPHTDACSTSLVFQPEVFQSVFEGIKRVGKREALADELPIEAATVGKVEIGQAPAMFVPTLPIELESNVPAQERAPCELGSLPAEALDRVARSDGLRRIDTDQPRSSKSSQDHRISVHHALHPVGQFRLTGERT